MQAKQFVYTIYTSARVFVRKLPVVTPVTPSETDELVLNTPVVTSEINGGQNTLTIDLDASFDDFGEGVSIKHGNRVELHVITDSYPLGKRLHTGIIVGYRPYLTGRSEGVRIVSISEASSLSQAFYKSGGAYVFTKSSIKASDLFEDIIDSFQSDYASAGIAYTGPSVEDSGVAITYDFSYKTCRQAIDEALSTAPAGWWWSVDGDGLASFRAKPSSSTHTFLVHKDIDSVELDKSIESVVNRLHLRWDNGGTPTYTTFSDATSISNYGLREKTLDRSSEITDSTTRDEFGNAYIANNKDVRLRASSPIVINDSYEGPLGERIEDIRPGDTCQIIGLKVGQNPFVANMQIVKVVYDGTTAQLILQEDLQNFARAVRM